MRLKSTLCFLMVSLFFSAFAQQQNQVDIALRALEDKSEEWNLSESDIENPLISDMYTSKHNGVTHVYVQQAHKGIPINDAIAAINIKDGKILYATSKFIGDVKNKVSTTEAGMTVEDAIFTALSEMEVPTSLTTLKVQSRSSENSYVFSQPDFSNSDVIAKLVYQLNDQNELVLVWDFTVDMKTDADYWSVRADASTGKIINKHNYTVYCKHEKHGYKNQSHDCAAHSIVDHKQSFKSSAAAIAMADASYNVFALPVESPIYGPQTIEEDPAILSSSPQGWHSTGTTDYTITRGNNVWAYADTDGNDISDGTEPDGGDALIFDFPYDSESEPVDLNGFAHVNLFYMVNMMHDISYAVGFTEEAGNFQQNNFGLGGIGGDYVQAEGQDGSGTNNANFATPPDGGNGRMQMFLWDNSGGLLRINAPSQLEGFYDSDVAGFGPEIVASGVDIEAECIVVDDNIGGNGGVETDGCTEIQNDLSGKIALIDRGSCQFSTKVFNAQEAGAVAVLICNIPGASTAGDDGNDPMGLGAGDLANSVTIPSLGVGKNTCDAIKLSLAAEIPVVAHIKNHDVAGPDLLDGDFDNGIIAHEFGHGISTRLTGGPSQGCLGGDEQMGEGWSDFFSLITTVEPGDTGADKRGIGNFAAAQNINGNGIRNYPYSTDMSINPTTYDYIKGINIPHGVGEVWCQMIWDMYWAFVDVYGWDADWTNTESGNYKAVLLVMDGMKMQGCNPGFIDGRNGILSADLANFDGDHQCLIWEVFARRGLGFFADQGSSNSAGDGTENFDSRPTCIEELKINKTMTRFVEAGDEVEVTLTITNHIPQVTTGVIATDEIPAGLTYINGSASMTANVTGDMLSFDLGDMEYEDAITITYRMLSDADQKSTSIEFYDMENLGNANDFFTREPLTTSTNFWNIVTSDAYSGSNSWYVESIDTEGDQALKTNEFIVSGTRPTVKFFHKWNTNASSDGGFMEISVDGAPYELYDNFFENDYDGALAYGTLAIPNINIFSGLQAEWVPTFGDLSPYIGQSISLRFRFATDEADSAGGTLPGWAMDDFEIMDLLTYESVACVGGTNVADDSCTDAATVFINSEPVSAVVDVDVDHFGMSIYPNPASQQVSVAISSKISEDGTAGIFTMDGRLIAQQSVSLNENRQQLIFDVSNVATGIYLVKVETNSGAITEKLVIK